uniref:PLA2c domain-containing protein n=1 Tax=Gadus morhua TaxID=8049 RepID=A0A8C4ZQU2_GADMO
LESSMLRHSGVTLIGHSLSEGETKYLSGRKLSVQKWLVKNNIPCSLSEVPNIAILGSGGGQRAMVGMLGSLSQMGEQGLLDAALYMSGVSGSTWCMASLYEKANWSSDKEQIKVVVERLGHGSVSLMERFAQLNKYFQTNDNFSLTDVWAALVMPEIVMKIDESTLSNYQTCHDKDPYPIFTVTNQDCKYECEGDPSPGLTPHEAGYTLAGAFVETSNFGSIFNKGFLTKRKPEMDMTYLQGLCGSALADKEVILEKFKEYVGGMPKYITHRITIANMLFVTINQYLLTFVVFRLGIHEGINILKFVEGWLKFWIWGTNYNYLYSVNAPHIDQRLLKREITHLEDAGLLVNSPYMSALRAEREIDLIISFDFSEGDPMEVRTKHCNELGISFPAIDCTKSDNNSPKGFYVFKGVKEAPTVIHIPLFNVENCGSELDAYIQKYTTFQGAYSPEMIEDLMKKAGENVLNHKEHLMEEIKAIVQQKSGTMPSSCLIA